MQLVMKAGWIAALTLLMAWGTGLADNRVVVIPLMSKAGIKPIKNVITVAGEGGDFDDPVAAVASITDASAENPYLVYVAPGVYTLTSQLVMKPYVSMTGSSDSSTVLTGSFSSSSFEAPGSLVRMANQATLSGMTIRNTADENYVIAVYAGGLNDSARLKGVRGVVSGGSQRASLYINNSSLVVEDCSFVAEGGYPSRIYGVYNDHSLSLLDGVRISISSRGSYVEGIHNSSSSSVLRNLDIDIDVTSWTNSATGIYSSGGASIKAPLIERASIDISGAQSCIGIENRHSGTVIRDTHIEVRGDSGSAGYYDSSGIYTTQPLHLYGVTATAMFSDGQQSQGTYGLQIAYGPQVVARHCLFSGYASIKSDLTSGNDVQVSHSTLIGEVAGVPSFSCVYVDDGQGGTLPADCGRQDP
jgi:hypothetical protein